jgi:hypothetical protein
MPNPRVRPCRAFLQMQAAGAANSGETLVFEVARMLHKHPDDRGAKQAKRQMQPRRQV